jgi:hypothetical protein
LGKLFSATALTSNSMSMIPLVVGSLTKKS